MEFQEVVRRRRMVRRYADRPVDRGVLDRMLANAVRAPSAGFTQGWAFLCLDTPEDVSRFWRSANPSPRSSNAWLDGMRTAPAIIVPLSSQQAYADRYAQPDKGWKAPIGERWQVPYWHVDVGMAALLILQTAVDEGLGACFFGVADVDSFRTEFGVPHSYTPVGAITVGHMLPDDIGTGGSPQRRPRQPLDEVVHRGQWQGSRPRTDPDA
ncbi:nitroreductase [Nocardioides gansuensis]|uniref:Nitroreductase n=1 Tax=Nocardioides gansuensis TaxID=2138300 RepID=A0A2T8F538_9ACTN|nr:nitroreductase family protein [Nocardioides gansuensis]PVG80819.1 nitroreductase [Nocardioides gansuensis]